jgi:hypothetical protein
VHKNIAKLTRTWSLCFSKCAQKFLKKKFWAYVYNFQNVHKKFEKIFKKFGAYEPNFSKCAHKFWKKFSKICGLFFKINPTNFENFQKHIQKIGLYARFKDDQKLLTKFSKTYG